MEAKDLERIVASAELRNPGVFNANRERYVAEISFKAGQEAERGRIMVVGDKLMEMLSHADFSNGVEASGMDEGRVRGYEMMKDLEKEWQALKGEK